MRKIKIFFFNYCFFLTVNLFAQSNINIQINPFLYQIGKTNLKNSGLGYYPIIMKKDIGYSTSINYAYTNINTYLEIGINYKMVGQKNEIRIINPEDEININSYPSRYQIIDVNSKFSYLGINAHIGKKIDMIIIGVGFEINPFYNFKLTPELDNFELRDINEITNTSYKSDIHQVQNINTNNKICSRTFFDAFVNYNLKNHLKLISKIQYNPLQKTNYYSLKIDGYTMKNGFNNQNFILNDIKINSSFLLFSFGLQFSFFNINDN